MINKIKKWFNVLSYVVANYHSDWGALNNRTGRLSTDLQQLTEIIKERNTINDDIAYKDGNTIILVGDYCGIEYIETYTMPPTEFATLVEYLQELKRYGISGKLYSQPCAKCSRKEA